MALLQKIPSDYPPEQAHRYDARLLACWKEDLLAECCDAQPWRQVYERAVQLEQHRSQLRNAVANGNPVEIAKAWVPLKRCPLPPELFSPVRSALTRVRTFRNLFDVVRHGRQEQLAEVFDTRILRQNAAAFAPYQGLLADWIPQEILPLNRIQLSLPVARKPLSLGCEPRGGAIWRVCWNWPHPRFADECLVTVCRRAPPPQADPRRFPAELRLRVEPETV